MRPRLLLCVALYLLGAGHVGAMVVQNPRYLVTGLGKPVTLSCSQNMKHDAMYWYQQKPSQAPKLLLYYYDKQITKEKNTSENFQSSRPIPLSVLLISARQAWGTQPYISVPAAAGQLLTSSTSGRARGSWC
uniref:TRB@ protein n=1 Tax=Bos taurus TaxID=9913 RepID=A6QPY9_BOVIN|nr:TRB@ protein [Bos taurus]